MAGDAGVHRCPRRSHADELWVEHEPVSSPSARPAKPEHVLMPGEIPVIHVDRGGQVTYHGPGQLVAYPLLTRSG